VVESISKDSLTLEAAPTRVVATAEGRRLLHDHKPRIVQMPNDMIGGDVGHQFVTLVKALPPVESKRERNGVSEVARVGGCVLVIHGPGGYRSKRTVEERNGLLSR
jgi:hypothetical protein